MHNVIYMNVKKLHWTCWIIYVLLIGYLFLHFSCTSHAKFVYHTFLYFLVLNFVFFFENFIFYSLLESLSEIYEEHIFF